MRRTPVMLSISAPRSPLETAVTVELDQLLSPRRAYGQPYDIVRDRKLSLAQKRALLTSWACDAQALALNSKTGTKAVIFSCGRCTPIADFRQHHSRHSPFAIVIRLGRFFRPAWGRTRTRRSPSSAARQMARRTLSRPPETVRAFDPGWDQGLRMSLCRRSRL